MEPALQYEYRSGSDYLFYMILDGIKRRGGRGVIFNIHILKFKLIFEYDIHIDIAHSIIMYESYIGYSYDIDILHIQIHIYI